MVNKRIIVTLTEEQVNCIINALENNWYAMEDTKFQEPSIRAMTVQYNAEKRKYNASMQRILNKLAKAKSYK